MDSIWITFVFKSSFFAPIVFASISSNVRLLVALLCRLSSDALLIYYTARACFRDDESSIRHLPLQTGSPFHAWHRI
jgi:hypothetical protein